MLGFVEEKVRCALDHKRAQSLHPLSIGTRGLGKPGPRKPLSRAGPLKRGAPRPFQRGTRRGLPASNIQESRHGAAQADEDDDCRNGERWHSTPAFVALRPPSSRSLPNLMPTLPTSIVPGIAWNSTLIAPVPLLSSLRVTRRVENACTCARHATDIVGLVLAIAPHRQGSGPSVWGDRCATRASPAGTRRRSARLERALHRCSHRYLA